MSDVKRAGKRAQKARETRARILRAAGELFVQDGYGATNLQDVATRAGVAVQTIYFVFGNKRTLLKELVDVTIAGDDEPVATMDRPWFKEALAAPTAAGHLRALVHGSSAVLARVAPIMKVLDTAVTMDPEVAAEWTQDTDPRHVVHTAAARSLMAKPGARADVPPEQAADVLYGLLSPELYLLLAGARGWPHERFEEWVHDTLAAQLLDR
ncbi:TetR/AcrR family transcriptional regulator [Nonomuraea salmonea]|jgi:AcrR family transcriptional regulator|uniref:TetR/AcrR family transcriptional regulator n=1 Tax=Nonomuraea salmonea TaxID=46181 RepID=A0ABV5NT93_9ACTN